MCSKQLFLFCCVFLGLFLFVNANQVEKIEEEEAMNYYYYFFMVLDVRYFDYGSLCDNAYEPVQLIVVSVVRFLGMEDYVPTIDEKMEEGGANLLHEPDFSLVTDAEDCKNYPEEWQVDCLNAVIGNMDARMDQMEDDIHQLAQDEVSLVQLQMAGSMLAVLLILLGLFICSCCCSTRGDRQFFDGRSEPKSLPYVYLHPINSDNGNTCHV